MTLESLDTRSIAPPIPFTILPCQSINQLITPIKYNTFYTSLLLHGSSSQKKNYPIFANNKNDHNVGTLTSMIFASKLDANGLTHVSSAQHLSHLLWQTCTETNFQKIKLLIPSIS